jgi:hypothetical protein
MIPALIRWDVRIVRGILNLKNDLSVVEAFYKEIEFWIVSGTEDFYLSLCIYLKSLLILFPCRSFFMSKNRSLLTH